MSHGSECYAPFEALKHQSGLPAKLATKLDLSQDPKQGVLSLLKVVRH